MGLLFSNSKGSSLLQVVIVTGVISVVSAGLMNIVNNQAKIAHSSSSKVAESSVGLTLQTYLSSARLCKNAVGNTQRITVAGGKSDLELDIRGLGRLIKNESNEKLGVGINELFLENITSLGNSNYEAILKYSVSEENTYLESIRVGNQDDPSNDNDDDDGVRRRGQLNNDIANTNIRIRQTKYGLKTAGKMRFKLNVGNTVENCVLVRI